MGFIFNSRASSQYGLQAFLSWLGQLRLGVPVLFLMIFLWLNGAYWWGASWEASTAMAYLLMFGLVLGITYNKSSVWLHQTPARYGMLAGLIGCLVMFAGLIIADSVLLGGSIFGRQIAYYELYPTIFLTVFFIALVEETLFRGVMKEYIKGKWLYFIPLAPVLTSAAFAVTHIMVYQGSAMSLQWAFLMGFVFYYMTEVKVQGRKLGIPGAIGAHACYNLAVLGVFGGVYL